MRLTRKAFKGTVVFLVIFILTLIAFISFEKYQAKNYFERAEEYREQGELGKALSFYEKAHRIQPLNRDVVHGYVGGLIYFKRNEDAYEMITNYFNKTDSGLYIDDMDLWVDKAISELQTNHCIDAGVSSWHVLARTLEGDSNNEIAGAVLSKAQKENCAN